MTHPHDTPPTPDALAQVLTPEERSTVATVVAASMADAKKCDAAVEIIARLVEEVGRLRQQERDRTAKLDAAALDISTVEVST